MSERMTDERMAEVCAYAEASLTGESWEVLNALKAERERIAELEEQIRDATEAMDELYSSVDSYYIEKGQVSTPKHVAYMEKWEQNDAD